MAAWTHDETDWIAANPGASYEAFRGAGFASRTYDAYRVKTQSVRRTGLGLTAAHVPPATAPRRSEWVPWDVPPAEGVAADLDDELGSALLDVIRAKEVVGDLVAPTDVVNFAPDDALPFAVAFTGDWHLGAAGVDVDRLVADLTDLAGAEGCWVVGMGDYLEGVNLHVKAASSLYSGAVNDGDGQEALFLRVASIVPAGKWLALVAGNHDEWLLRHGGLSRVSRIGRTLGVTTFPQGGGTIRVCSLDDDAEVLGEWRVGVAHTHRGRSTINTTNEQRRMFDSWPAWENCDVLVVGHLHYPEVHRTPRKGRLVSYVRSGTYKLRDAYARDHNFAPMAGVPVAIFRPDGPTPLVFDSHHDALPVLAAMRRHYVERREAA